MKDERHEIVQYLDDLRHDEKLWKAVRTIEESAAAWKAGLRPSHERIEGHRAAVRTTLQVLSEQYLARFFQELDQPAVILLNYQSALGSLGEVRIASEPWPLTSHLPATADLSAHIHRELDEGWRRLREIPNYFQLHRLAQPRVLVPNGALRRTPVYVSPRPERPGWATGLKSTKPPGILLDEHGRPYAALYCPERSRGITTQGLREFAGAVASHQDLRHRYPDDSTRYERYEDYINQLLGWNGGMWLCTVAVSDELTDLPLGTAMIFSEHAPDPTIAAKINALCFEVMNAIEKIEWRALTLADTSKALAAWVNHETKGWFSVLDQHLSRLRRTIEQAEDKDKHAGIRDELRSIHDRLYDLKTYGPNVVELLNHFTGKESGKISREAFCGQVSAYLRSKEIEPNVDVTIDQAEVPKTLMIIAYELVRTAHKHHETAAGELVLHVRIGGSTDSVVLEVCSQPHAKRHRDQLALCNKHANDYFADRLAEFTSAIDSGKKLGHWSVIRMAQAIEAEPPSWTAKEGKDGYLEVTASVTWRPKE